MIDQERLFKAIESNNVELVQELCLENEDLVNSEDIEKETPLIMAIIYGHNRLVDLLLTFSPDLHVQSYLYGTALTAAIFKQEWELVERLLKAEQEQYGVLQPGLHPGAFLWTLRHGNLTYIEKFIQSGANVNTAMQTCDGKVCYEDPTEWVWPGLDFDDYAFGRNPLKPDFDLPLNVVLKSSIDNEIVVINTLLQYGADPDLKGYAQQTARELACYRSYKDTLLNLFDHKDLIKLDSKSTQTHKISLELLKFFLEPIELYGQCIAEDNNIERRDAVLQLLLNAEVVDLEFFIKRAYQLDQDNVTGLVFLGCCLNPEFWNNSLLASLKKTAVESFVERSSAAEDIFELKAKKEKFLINKANLEANKMLDLLTEKLGFKEASFDYQSMPISLLPTNVILNNKPLELACFTEKGRFRKPERVTKVLEASVYKQEHGCRWCDLPPCFPNYNAIYFLVRELKKRGLYEALKRSYQQLIEKKDESTDLEHLEYKSEATWNSQKTSHCQLPPSGGNSQLSSDAVKVTSDKILIKPE